MTDFDFLHDAAPVAVERLRAIRLSERLATPLWTACAILAVALVIRGTLAYRLEQTRQECEIARMRFQVAAAAFAQTKLERTRLETLLALDGHLRAIRLSGSQLSLTLADVANRIPARAWLTSISRSPDGIILEGQAEGVRVLGDTIGALTSSRRVMNPMLVRASDTDGVLLPGVLSFELRLQERT